VSDIVDQRVEGLAVYRRDRSAGTTVAEGGAPAVPVVLVHGSMDRGASFLKACRQVPGQSILYDRRGYGRSVSAGVAVHLRPHIDDLHAVLAATVNPSQGCVLVGHSLGGVLALAAAQEDPARVRAVGAFEAPMPWTTWWPGSSAGGRAVERSASEGPAAAAEDFMRRMIGNERWERLPPSTKEARRAEGPALLAELVAMRSLDEPPYDLAAIAQPIVSGYGTRSLPHHIDAAKRLATNARDAELVVIEGAFHGAHYSHPKEFAAFNDRVRSRAGGPRGLG